MVFHSFGVLLLTCFLLFILQTSALPLSFLRTDTLECLFRPLLEKDRKCAITTTRCLPDEVCVSSKGYRGPEYVLNAQGCIKRQLCGSTELKFRFKRPHNVTYTCCCEDKCNTIMSVKLRSKGPNNVVNIHQDLHVDSCANYKSPLTAKAATEWQ